LAASRSNDHLDAVATEHSARSGGDFDRHGGRARNRRGGIDEAPREHHEAFSIDAEPREKREQPEQSEEERSSSAARRNASRSLDRLRDPRRRSAKSSQELRRPRAERAPPSPRLLVELDDASKRSAELARAFLDQLSEPHARKRPKEGVEHAADEEGSDDDRERDRERVADRRIEKEKPVCRERKRKEEAARADGPGRASARRDPTQPAPHASEEARDGGRQSKRRRGFGLHGRLDFGQREKADAVSRGASFAAR